MPAKPDDSYLDQRKFSRLSTACAIEFTIVRLQGDLPGMDWHRGITQDVSCGGLCLEVDFLRASVITFLKEHNVSLDLKIHTPFTIKPIRAVCEVAWFQTIEDNNKVKHMIGLKFRKITSHDLSALMSQTEAVNSVSRIMIGVSVLVTVLLILALVIVMV